MLSRLYGWGTNRIQGGTTIRKLFEIGGTIAGAVLVIFGVAAIAMGVNGRNEVRDAIAEQKIPATPDAAAITNGKLQPGQEIKTGSEARSFADIMEFHALESTEGKRFAEMGRFLTASGEETSDARISQLLPDTMHA